MCVVRFANLDEPSAATTSISIYSDGNAANPTINGNAVNPTIDGAAATPTIRFTFEFPRVVSTWPRLHTYTHNNRYFQ